MDIKSKKRFMDSLSLSQSMDFEPSSYEDAPLSLSDMVSRKCVLGICCMDEKCFGKPMQNILSRLKAYGDFDIVIFGEHILTTEPPEHWPQCDCMIAFFSKGFPLKKAIRYMELHPTTYCVNDLVNQEVLLDRRAIFNLLQKNGIPGAKRLVISRDGTEPQQTFVESQNWIEIDGVRLEKPFVEKPANGEDHNVYIYYHEQQGGGSVRLFRKIGDKSSERFPDVHNVRSEGSYVYEEYIATENAYDIKVYTVGADFAHAEARKSPVVDGNVIRDSEGKEVRYTVELTEEEKKMAQKLVRVLGQNVCGFDLLRDSRTGQSYICDVNGWSFVKGNHKFYDDCARILRDLLLKAMVSRGLPIIRPKEGVHELRGMISVFRHADRTPKQKIKLKTTNKEFISFFGDQKSERKFKSDSNKAELEALLELVVNILNDTGNKYEGVDEKDKKKLYLIVNVLKNKFGGLKVQLKPVKHVHKGFEDIEITQCLIIVKWGGILTHSGITQANKLGKTFYERVIPGLNKGKITSSFKVYSNNERRVKRTAEEFSSGFSGLKSIDELPKDIVNDSKESVKMLGTIAAGKRLMDKMKIELDDIMHMEDTSGLDIPGIEMIPNPLQTMREIEELMRKFQMEQEITKDLCEGETAKMMEARWGRLSKNFYNPETGRFDVTKIPDIFDYITYEVIHNQKAIGHDLYELFQKSLNLARFVVVQEYGITSEDKFTIGSCISRPLIRSISENLSKICRDTEEKKEGEPKLFFYFSSESHLQSLRNILLHSGVSKFHQQKEPLMLNYLTHIVFKVYENLELEEDQAHRFSIEVLFSTGTSDNPFGINDDHLQPVAPMISVHDRLSFRRFEEIVRKATLTAENMKHHKDKSTHE